MSRRYDVWLISGFCVFLAAFLCVGIIDTYHRSAVQAAAIEQGRMRVFANKRIAMIEAALDCVSVHGGRPYPAFATKFVTTIACSSKDGSGFLAVYEVFIAPNWNKVRWTFDKEVANR